MSEIEYLNPYLTSQERWSVTYDTNHQYCVTQYAADSQNPETGLPRSDTGAHHTPADSILQDDETLFQNYDRFLAGDIDQQEFQAGYCRRLLFIWEWVFELCFSNFPSALQSWYRILEKEDVWLWVDGDETQGPLHRLIHPYRDHGGPTDLHPTCNLSRADLQRGVNILRNRLQQEFDPRISSPWHRQLDQHPNALLRYAAVILKIATSDPIQALDAARRIKGRSVGPLLKGLARQFSLREIQCPRWDTYTSEMRRSGHTCIWSNDRGAFPAICILLNLLDVLAPDFPIIFRNDYYIYCQMCEKTSPLLISDIPWNGAESRKQSESELTHAAVPSNLLRFLWCLWFSSVDLDVHSWIRWLALLADYTRCTDFWNRDRARARLILACLVSPQMETWITSTTDNDTLYLYLDQSCFGSGAIVDSLSSCRPMYTPTPDNWNAAKVALSRAEPMIEHWQKLPDVLATLGVLLHWMSSRSVATSLLDIYTFRDLLCKIYEEEEEDLPCISKDAVPSDVKSWIMQAEPRCCPQVDANILDWYIASAALVTPTNEIDTGRSRICRCPVTSTPDDVTRVFNNFLDIYEDFEVEEVCRALAAAAKRHGYNGGIFSTTTGDSDSSDNEADQVERIAPTMIITPRKPSKSHQIEAIKTHILNHLRELEAATRQIPSLSSGGTQKASLPWKTLTQILKERGYELESWPVEVPLPGSGSEFCDDNKGIHGLKTKHLRALYDATQDKAKPLGFRRVGDMVPATVRMDEAVRRRGTVRGREASEEREAGPSKRRRVDWNGAGPSWDGN